MDRLDLGFCAKEMSRKMSQPSQADEIRMKRIIRYLQCRPRGVYTFQWQSEPRGIECQVDADWGGCLRTRRSTSGGIVFRGRHVLGHWSRTQAVVALSSGEAELNASLKGACESIGVRELMREWGKECTLTILGDSSACQGTLAREGCGRQKHLEIRQLWLQTHIRSGSIVFRRIPRAINIADALTKHWAGEAIQHFKTASFAPIAVDTQRGSARVRGSQGSR